MPSLHAFTRRNNSFGLMMIVMHSTLRRRYGKDKIKTRVMCEGGRVNRELI